MKEILELKMDLSRRNGLPIEFLSLSALHRNLTFRQRTRCIGPGPSLPPAKSEMSAGLKLNNYEGSERIINRRDFILVFERGRC